MARPIGNRSAPSPSGLQYVNDGTGNVSQQVPHPYGARWQLHQQQFPYGPTIQQPWLPHGQQNMLSLQPQGLQPYNSQGFFPQQQPLPFAGPQHHHQQRQSPLFGGQELFSDIPPSLDVSWSHIDDILPLGQWELPANGTQQFLPGQQQPLFAGPQHEQPSLVQQPLFQAGPQHEQPPLFQQPLLPADPHAMAGQLRIALAQEGPAAPAAHSPSPIEVQAPKCQNGRPRKKPHRKVGPCHVNACARCRKAKVKCQRGTPGQACTRCTDNGLDCVQDMQDMRTTESELQSFRSTFDSWHVRWIRRFRVGQWLKADGDPASRSTRFEAILAAEDGDLEKALEALYEEEGRKPESDLNCPLPAEGHGCFADTRDFLAGCHAGNAVMLADVRKQHRDFLQKAKHYVEKWDKVVGGRGQE